MKSILLLVISLLLSLCIAQNQGWKLCSQDSPLLITSIQLEPDPVRRNFWLNTTATGILKLDQVTGGIVDMPVFFNGRQVTRYKYEICKYVIGGCPVKRGENTIYLYDKTPSFAFTGNYTIKAKVYNENYDELACVDVWFRMT